MKISFHVLDWYARRYATRGCPVRIYSERVDVVEIADGFWRWTGYHEEWKENVGCVYCETVDGVVLVDPLVPPEDTERFWRALDRDVERNGGRVHVLVTVFWHTRSTAAMVERYAAQVWAPGRGRAAIARRAGTVTDPFRPDDRLPGGVQPFATAKAAEVVYWIPEHQAVVPGDVLLGDGGGGIRMCPESWLPERVDHAGLAESLRPLLDLPVERVLVSHGEPLLERGSAALAAALK
jgi:glyoxylase-like metal-dependent hydrolase (beta-lactamase superfamily II)